MNTYTPSPPVRSEKTVALPQTAWPTSTPPIRPPQPPQPPTTPYMYTLHHQLLTPVAHVPIGAAHYAHLPSSIWAPPHPPSYHHPTRPPIIPHLHPTPYPTPPHPVPLPHQLSYPAQYPHLPPHHLPAQPALKLAVSIPTGPVPHPHLPYHLATLPALPAPPPDRPEPPTPQQAPLPAPVQNASLDNEHPAQSKAACQSETPSSHTGATPLRRIQQTTGQPPRKPRKPYTITKPREVWTTEEHARFVHALQLYDREWKKIEAYIGTKTALQIRSHAQKHFGKVTKNKTGEYIPPPRPKKRATMPYPRSRPSTQLKSTAGTASTGTNSDSGAGSENGTLSGSYSPGAPAPNQTSPDMHQSDDHLPNARSAKAARVAGRTQAHQQRVRAGLNASGGKNTPYGAHNPYYNPALSSNSYQPRDPARNSAPGMKPASSSPVGRPVPQSATASIDNVAQQQPPSNLYPSRGRIEMRPHPQYARDKQTAMNAFRPAGVCNRNLSSPSPNKQSAPSGADGNITANGLSDNTRTCPSTVEDGRPRLKDTTSRMNAASNSLIVLSNCVDMIASDAPPERQPAAGWASAAAARRAHRAKVIRSRKPPLPSSIAHGEGGSVTGNSPRCNTNREVYRTGALSVQGLISPQVSEKPVDNQGSNDSSQQRVPSPIVEPQRSRSPPTVPQDEANRPSQDPQRSSAGSANHSDDAIAGFSSSDRPSVSDMAGGMSSGGSGSGGSLDNSDAGEEDPKSSNDGSGDDGNRQSPSTRGSSPADPASSGSRENTPTMNSENNGIVSQQKPVEVGNLLGPKFKESDIKAGELLKNLSDKDILPPCHLKPEDRRLLSAPVKPVEKTQGPHSIRSLCSDIPREEDKFDIIHMKENVRKRPRSPLLSPIRPGREAKQVYDPIEDKLQRRKCPKPLPPDDVVAVDNKVLNHEVSKPVAPPRDHP